MSDRLSLELEPADTLRLEMDTMPIMTYSATASTGASGVLTTWMPRSVAAGPDDLVLTSVERLVREGGDMTGGMLGADEIVFSDKESPPSDETEKTDGGEPMSDEELRSIWLRQVQTKPADFLRAKFAYQHATRPTATGAAQ